MRERRARSHIFSINRANSALETPGNGVIAVCRDDIKRRRRLGLGHLPTDIELVPWCFGFGVCFCEGAFMIRRASRDDTVQRSRDHTYAIVRFAVYEESVCKTELGGGYSSIGGVSRTFVDWFAIVEQLDVW